MNGYGRIKGARAAILLPRHQADAILSQAAPVSGTKYTVLATKSNVRIISMAVQVTWTVQPSPLEVHVTIDGQSLTFSTTNPASATNYFANTFAGSSPTAQLLTLNADDITKYRAFLLEGRSVKVEVETTGGTVSNITAKIVYAQW